MGAGMAALPMCQNPRFVLFVRQHVIEGPIRFYCTVIVPEYITVSHVDHCVVML